MTDPPVLTPGQVQRLLDYIVDANGTPAKHVLGIRNKTILLLMLDAGLRSNEVRQLTLRDLYFQATPRDSVQIRPEIAKYRVGGLIPLSPRLRAALDRYAQAYGLYPLSDTDQAAFAQGKLRRALTTRQLRRIIARAGRVALDRHTWCHLMRHTFGDNLRGVADIGTRMQLMRHKDVRSTMVYDHPTDTDKRHAIDAVARRQQEPTP